MFRNEGLDTRHNPEFTMLEAYQAYADYRDMMDLVEALITRAAHEALGGLVVSYGGQRIDLTPPWPRLRMADLLRERTGADMSPLMPVADARAQLAERGVAYERGWGAGRLMKELYDEKVQHDVTGPLFCLDYPA
nr:amino acid--tRNA ligase-related protein [Micromonospora sp. DSM 115978]